MNMKFEAIFSRVYIQCINVTDGRTDRQTLSRGAGKKYKF